jgi:hypothetical protein
MLGPLLFFGAVFVGAAAAREIPMFSTLDFAEGSLLQAQSISPGSGTGKSFVLRDTVEDSQQSSTLLRG